jgi:hypothetical protein
MGIYSVYNRINWKANKKRVTFHELNLMLPATQVCREVVQMFDDIYDKFGIISINHLGSGIVNMVYDRRRFNATRADEEDAARNGDMKVSIALNGVDIEAEIGDETDRPHYCGDDRCEGECGIQDCGLCIDVCRCEY